MLAFLREHFSLKILPFIIGATLGVFMVIQSANQQFNYEYNCSDGIDNDSDSLVDCRDTDCTFSSACAENCTNGVDDDNDGSIDCNDAYCTSHPAC